MKPNAQTKSRATIVTAALAGGLHQIEVAEDQLLADPDDEEEDRRDLEDREEEDDEDERDHAGAREQEQVAAEHRRHRARGPDAGNLRARRDEDLPRVR